MLFGIFFVSIEAKQLDMKTILRNFFSVLRRFKTASVLNVLGLSIAFVAFMLIMMQVNYDYTFDRSHPNADAIFRVDIVHGSKGSQAIICRPFARAFTGSSPLIEEGCLLSAWTESRFFYIEDGGQRTSYKEEAWNVTPGVLEVFRFDMLEGNERSLDEPNSVVLPESMARKIFGDESAVGKQLISANPMEDAKIVKGVYKDFPRNSALKNVMYTSMSPKENYDNWGNWNYFFFVRLGEGMDKAEVLDNFKRNFNAKEAFGNEFEWGEENSLDLRLTSLPDVHFLSNVDFDSMPKASRQTLLVLFSIAFVILIIAGINFTNFSTGNRHRSDQLHQLHHGTRSDAHQEHQHAEGAGQFRPYVAWKFVGRGGLRQSVCLSAFASFLIHNPQNTGSLAGGCRYLVRGAADDHCRHGGDRGDRGSAGRPLSFLLCHLFPAGIGVERKLRPLACRAPDEERAGGGPVCGFFHPDYRLFIYVPAKSLYAECAVGI